MKKKLKDNIEGALTLLIYIGGGLAFYLYGFGIGMTVSSVLVFILLIFDFNTSTPGNKMSGLIMIIPIFMFIVGVLTIGVSFVFDYYDETHTSIENKN